MLLMNLIYQPILLIISQSIICYVLYRLGFFKWAAHTIVFTAEESEVKLLLHILLFSLLLAVLTNVYAAIIVSIFLIFDISENINLCEYKIVKFILISNLFIDISSIMSPFSSLNNLLYMKLLNIGYNSFIVKLFIPGLISVFTLYIFIYVMNRKALTRFANRNIVNPDIFVQDWILLNLCILAIFLIQISYFLVQNTDLPIYLIPLIISLLLLLYMIKREKLTIQFTNSKKYIFFIMTISMLYLIIYGLFHNRNYFYLVLNSNTLFTGISASTKISVFFASTLFSSILGDIPGAFISVKFMEMTKALFIGKQSLIYISIVGNIIGGKVLFYGSLSNIISKRMLAGKGFTFTFIEYFRMVFPSLVLCSVVFILTALWII